jgi:pimeloyl-ACP methyl ester carboxylesterase
MRQLIDRGGAIAIDLRGHGNSDRDPRGQYSIERHALDVRFVLDFLGVRRVVLIGQSLGAAVAVRVAAARPNRLARLVLVDGGVGLSREALEFIREEFCRQPWRYSSVDEYTRALERRLPLTGAAVLRDLAPHALGKRSVGYELKCDPALCFSLEEPDDSSLWPLLDSLACPILLVRGAGSAVLSQAAAQGVVARLRNCALKVVPRAGHAVMLDNPSGLFAALEEFVRDARDETMATQC